MSLLDFFRKKKKLVVEKKVKKPLEKKAPVKSEPKRGKSTIAYKVLMSPHITEKASNLAESNKYTFNVFPRANKTEIKKGVSELYGVDVVDVKIINIHRKKRKVGRTMGWKKGYKKAIVKLKKGQKIEVMPR